MSNYPHFNLRRLFYITTVLAIWLGLYCISDEAWFQNVVVNVAQFVIIPSCIAIVAYRVIQSMRAFQEGVRAAREKDEN